VTYADPALRQLQTYLTGQGIPVLGIVGDVAHKRGYHVGKDRIFGPGGQGWSDYSVRTARDKAGLSNAATAIDIGRHNGIIELLAGLRAEARAGRAPDIREIISERGDGSHIWRYDAVTGSTTGDPASRELPHHGHVSYFRDSEGRTKLPVYQRVIGLPDTGTEEEMIYTIKGVPGPFPCTVKPGTPYYSSATDSSPQGTIDTPDRAFTCVAESKDGSRRAVYGRMATTADRSVVGWVASTAVNRG
jgi:hypothetical protein